jgi:hypothetical protein
MKHGVEQHTEQESLQATLKKAHALPIQLLSGIRLRTPGGRHLSSRQKGGLLTFAVALVAAGVWLTMPETPEAETTSSSMDAVLRSAPSDLPTLSADTF